MKNFDKSDAFEGMLEILLSKFFFLHMTYATIQKVEKITQSTTSVSEHVTLICDYFTRNSRTTKCVPWLRYVSLCLLPEDI